MSRNNKNKQSNFEVGRDLNASGNGNVFTSKQNKNNQINKSENINVTIYQQVVHELKQMNSLDNMSDREGLQVVYNKDGSINTNEIIQVQGYAVKYKDIDRTYKSAFTGKECVRLLVINIHQQIPQGWQYKCDHIHLYVPEELINENLEGRIINIKGFVYPYENDKKRSIEATSIKIPRDEIDKEDEPQRIKPSKNFMFDSLPIKGREELLFDNKFKKQYKRFDEVERMQIMMKLFYVLEYCLDGNFFEEFITNYIVTQYSCNYSPSLVRQLDYKVVLKDPIASTNVSIISAALIYDIIHKEIIDVPELFNRLTVYLNTFLDLHDGNRIKSDGNKKPSNKIILAHMHGKELGAFRTRVQDISENFDLVAAYKFAILKIDNFNGRKIDEKEIIVKAMEIIFNNDFYNITKRLLV